MSEVAKKSAATKRKSQPTTTPENSAENTASMEVDASSGIEGRTRPLSSSSTAKRGRKNTGEVRKVSVPSHRYSPLKENWMKIFTPVVEQLHLQIRWVLVIYCFCPVQFLTIIINGQSFCDFQFF